MSILLGWVDGGFSNRSVFGMGSEPSAIVPVDHRMPLDSRAARGPDCSGGD